MLKWIAPIIGLIALALGIVIFFEGSQETTGIAIIAISAIVILVGIGLLFLKKKPKTGQSAPVKTEAPETAEPDEEPPVF